MKKIHFILIALAILLASSTAFAELPDDAVPVNQSHEQYIANWRSLQKGMTQAQVRHLLGEPDKIDDNYTDNPTWRYYVGGDPYAPSFGRSYIKFGTTGPLWKQKKRVVVEWQEP